MYIDQKQLAGAGLGLRRAFIRSLQAPVPAPVSFMEVAPENWIDVGGRFGHWFTAIAESCPIVCHGLSLDLGGMRPLNEPFVQQVKKFLDRHNVLCYSEHLSYCADEQGYLYDLMPIPFTYEAVRHVAARIKRTQEITERRIAVENVSYYAAPGSEMDEIDFLLAVLEEADCDLLLDVNNIYVNSINHCYDPVDFIRKIPEGRVRYAHMAGHYKESEDLRVDTHGADVPDPVWDLLHQAYQHLGVFPTLLERDFNIPPLPQLLSEVERIGSIQQQYKGVDMAAIPYVPAARQSSSRTRA